MRRKKITSIKFQMPDQIVISIKEKQQSNQRFSTGFQTVDPEIVHVYVCVKEVLTFIRISEGAMTLNKGWMRGRITSQYK